MNREDIKYLTPGSAAMITLLDLVSQADVDKRSLRILFQGDEMSLKVGEDMWTYPMPVYNETNRPV